MTDPKPATAQRSRASMILGWLLRIALALVFAGAGFAKLAGDPAMLQLFDDIGAGQGLRYVVGGLELAGAVGLLVPRLCGLAAAGLALLMIGATVTNIAVLGVSPAFTLLLLALAAVIVFLRRRRLNPLVPGDGVLTT
jgi:putative oxidoreductase